VGGSSWPGHAAVAGIRQRDRRPGWRDLVLPGVPCPGDGGVPPCLQPKTGTLRSSQPNSSSIRSRVQNCGPLSHSWAPVAGGGVSEPAPRVERADGRGLECRVPGFGCWAGGPSAGPILVSAPQPVAAVPRDAL
jgi:hypothetical protein